MRIAIIILAFSLIPFYAEARIVATIKPLHSLVQGIVGETEKVTLLVKGNHSAHGFYLKPSHIKLINNAEVIFYIGPSHESFLNNALENLKTRQHVHAASQAEGLTLLEYRGGSVWRTHQHQRYHTQLDPHLWLDPRNAIHIIHWIKKILARHYPENKTTYARNAKQLTQKLTQLDQHIKKQLKDVQQHPFIVFHDAYQYFEHAYHLSANGSITNEPDEAPSAKHLSTMRALEKTCVFKEPQFSDRLVKTVIEGSNAKASELDPLGGQLEEGEGLYFNLLEKMTIQVKNCLTQPQEHN